MDKRKRKRDTGKLTATARTRLWSAIDRLSKAGKILHNKDKGGVKANEVYSFAYAEAGSREKVSKDLVADFMSINPSTHRSLNKARLLFEYLGISLTDSAEDWIYMENPKSSDIKSEANEAEHKNMPDCPYPGLFAFREENSKFFFGRESFIDQLVIAVENQPLVIVNGPSGIGKSSVIFAGLVPQLRIKNEWLITSFRTGRMPFLKLAESIVKTLEPDFNSIEQTDGADKLALNLQKPSLSITSYIEKISEKYENKRLLLIIDQFEELFTQVPETDKNIFLDKLVGAIKNEEKNRELTKKSKFVILLTVRDDFLPKIVESSLGIFIDRFKPEFLRQMEKDELKKAIEEPAKMQNVQIEDCLTDRILAEVKEQAGLLPCLEFALSKLWEKQLNGVLDFKSYNEIGGIRESLALHADKELEKFSEQEKKQIEQIFIQLVNFDKKQKHTRRIATKTEIGSGKWDLIRFLADSRLVVTSRDEGTSEDTVEIVHEALIDGWNTLQQWIQNNNEFRTWQESIRLNMERWNATNRNEGGLLREIFLLEAENWLKGRGTEISSKEKKFIERSREFADSGIKEKEKMHLEVRLSDIKNLILLSQLQLQSNFQIEALTSALEACTKVQNFDNPSTEIQGHVINCLQEVLNCVQEKNRWEAHLDDVNWITISADNELIATASSDRTVKLWKLSGELVRTFVEKSRVYGVAFSPDNQSLAFANADTTVNIWRIDGKLIHSLREHEEVVNKVAYSHDGKKIASASDDRKVNVWDTTGLLIKTLPHDDMVYDVSFSHDGRLLASASLDKYIRIWELKSWSLLCSFEAHEQSANHICFSPENDCVVSTGGDSKIKLWDISGTLLKTIEGHSESVTGISFNRSGELIVSASQDKTIKVWRRKDGSLAHTFYGHEKKVCNAFFGPDERKIISTGSDKTVRFWQLNNKVLQHSDNVRSVVFSPTENSILTASDDKVARLWSSDGLLLQNFIGHSGKINYACFTPNNSLICTASLDRTVRFWNLDGEVHGHMIEHSDSVNNVSFHPNGNQIATSSTDKKVRIWSTDGELIRTYDDHTDRVLCVVYSPDGKLLVSSSFDKKIIIRNLCEDRAKIINAHEDKVSGVVFSPDGKLLVSFSRDKSIKVWDVNGNFVQVLNHHTDEVSDVCFSPTGNLIASASFDKTIVVCDLDGNIVNIYKGHTDNVTGICFSHDGTMIASSSSDQTTRLWQFVNAKEISGATQQLKDLNDQAELWLNDYKSTHCKNKV
jgi:WD40 repeat protein